MIFSVCYILVLDEGEDVAIAAHNLSCLIPLMAEVMKHPSLSSQPKEMMGRLDEVLACVDALFPGGQLVLANLAYIRVHNIMIQRCYNIGR